MPVKVKLPAGMKVTAVAAGGYYSLALTSTGAVLAWGYNGDGELGNGKTDKQRCAGEGEAACGQKVTAVAAGGSLEGVGEATPAPAIAWR